MNKKTRTLTLSAFFSALCLISLYFASVWPTGLYGIVAFSSLFVTAAVIETGILRAVYVFAVSSALGMVILPNKAPALLYLLFFGYYPILKSLAERARLAIIRLFLKHIFFNAALAVIWAFLRGVFFGFSDRIPGAFIVFILGNVVFVLFDYGYSKVISFYMSRISKYLKKG